MTRANDDSSVVSEGVWLALLVRDEFKCLNCLADEDLQPAHYIARSLAGSDNLDNLMLLCNYCHRKLHDYKLIVKKIDGHFYFKEISPRSHR